MDILTRLRAYAMRAVAVLVLTSTVTSTVESYMGLRAWAAEHGVIGAGSYIFPGFIDAFPLAAEGVLFVAYVDQWKGRARVLPWVVLTGGLAVSVGLNVGHIHTTDVWTQATNGAPPVATWLSLLVGTAMFKRIMANKPKPVEAVAVEPETPVDELQDELEYIPMPASGPDLKAAAAAFEGHIKDGKVPGRNLIRKTLHVGHDKAPIIQAHLKELATR